jgi:hypothetical protein
VRELRYTLLSDGSSDRALIPILTWLLRQSLSTVAIQPRWADLRQLRTPPGELHEKIRLSLELYPCDLLFVHRDAENQSGDRRRREIQAALKLAAGHAGHINLPRAICVIPVRMAEAWLLFQEQALRLAAGNPNGRQQLNLPDIDELEAIPDPKRLLYDLLRQASGLRGRRLKKFPAHIRASRVADVIDDFAPLRALPAFSALEGETRRLVDEYAG